MKSLLQNMKTNAIVSEQAYQDKTYDREDCGS